MKLNYLKKLFITLNLYWNKLYFHINVEKYNAVASRTINKFKVKWNLFESIWLVDKKKNNNKIKFE